MAWLFVFVLITQSLLGVESQTSTRWQCGMIGCLCSSVESQTDVYNIDEGNMSQTAASCYLKTKTHLPSVVSLLPPNITSLTISCARKNTTTVLYQDMFFRHPHIKDVTFEGCRFQHIHPKFASGADKLAKLSFLHCNLPMFINDTLSNIQSLKFLSVTSSSMVNLPRIQPMKNLQILHLFHNKVKFPQLLMDDTANNTLTELVNVSLANNGIKNIQSEFFKSVPHLKYLNLDGNDIKIIAVPPNATQQLETFTAIDNPMGFIDFSWITSMSNLTQFRISGSGQNSSTFEKRFTFKSLLDLKISGFKLNDSFWKILNIPSLVKLDLSFNELETVDLSQLPNVRKVYLQGNNISELHTETFKYQQNLLVVNISFNNISHLHEKLFAQSSNLLGFMAKGNKITEISSRFFDNTPRLFYVDLSHNEITRLPFGLLSKTPNLLFLYINGNGLSFLPSFSNLKILHVLDISYNHIHSLNANSLRGLVSLELLYANDNQMVIIPTGLFDHCPSLLSANFNSNKIKHIGSLGHHPKLLKLEFQNNSLTDFTNISPFAHMQVLESIFLDQNEFYTIYPNMFPNTVTIVSMSQNNISQILVKSFNDMNRLTLVNFMRSKNVIFLPQSSVHRYTAGSLKPSINLGFSYLSCNCWLGYLKVWDEERHDIPELLNRFPNFEGLENAGCISPLYPDSEFFFRDLPLRDFVCEYSEPMCLAGACDCCNKPDNESCSCVYTCPADCQCFEGGSGFWKRYVHIICSERNLTHAPSLIPPLATFIYLDGNKIDHLKTEDVSHLIHVEELYLNNSGIKSIEDGLFSAMDNIQIIQMSNNLLKSIRFGTFGNINSLTHLDLSNNRISQIEVDSFEGLVNLQTLHLHNNQMKYISSYNLFALPNLNGITLAFNNWSCDCDVIENLSSFVLRRENSDVIKDKKSICCRLNNIHKTRLFKMIFHPSHAATKSQDHRMRSIDRIFDASPNDNNTYISNNSSNIAEEITSHHLSRKDTASLKTNDSGERDKKDNQTCYPLVSYDFVKACDSITNITVISTVYDNSGTDSVIIIALASTATVLILIILSIIVFTLKRKEIQAFAYAKTGIRILDTKANLDKKDKGRKPFDAFISYSQRDHEYVCNTMVPGLESNGYRVCVHYRDFPVGGEICDIINRAIRLSSRTIIIVSRHFLESNWCRYEFQTAHHHVLKKGSHRLILVLMEEIPEGDMDPDFRTTMKINTYLKVQDAWFWEKLRFSLPEIADRNKGGNDEDDDNMMMRGMRILATMKDISCDNNDDIDDGDSIQNEIVQTDGERIKEGGDEMICEGMKNDKITNKIDWKREAERIWSERRSRENITSIDEEGLQINKGIKNIDWKREEERILSDKQYREKMLSVDRYRGTDAIGHGRYLGRDWVTSDINGTYVNTAFELNME